MTEPRKGNQPKSNANPEFGDLPDRLKDLGNRIAAEKVERAEASSPNNRQHSAADHTQGYKLLSEFVAAILAGSALGYGIDYVAGTAPWFLIIFLLLGFVAGIMNMVRESQKTELSPEEVSKLPSTPADEEED